MPNNASVVARDFHVSRQARDRYQFDDWLFSLRGNVVFANFHAARVFAQRMNEKRDLVNFPEQAVRAGQINAMGLIHELLHRVIAAYREQVNPAVMDDALRHLYERLSRPAVDTTLLRFIDEFPPLPVYRREVAGDEYFEGRTGETTHREIALEELLMVWLSNSNPAFAPFLELYDDSGLERETAYVQIFSGQGLQEFFDGQPSFSGQLESLLDILRGPVLASPHSLAGQLEYIRQRWGFMLGRDIYRLLGSLDLIKEEEKAFFAGGGPGPVEVYNFAGLEVEREAFTADREWMPQLVLMAKNAYVWLDQLAKRYQRPINTLADIPDEELDQLARGGFTGLWLIGLWERSLASQRIKQIMGNPEAVASAYSLMDYRIASDLGGDAALDHLRQRAWQRGIRLASDMVPNHMGIDSRWVVEHPDWFLSLDYSPYPSYTFNGPDLSWDERVGIYIEDHYFNRSDAAVVFKRVDRQNGGEKYIYHGNDGTSMPWNDTAQLDYLKAEVREAVIQTILQVARQFPVIRFDAAMTLAKRHVQRLWYPEPGSGGAIASRSDYGMTKAQFDALMPQEFWREVVDRAAVEAPDTLLLAEAFWLMEGYFVRTLGMHRVYNSAFMVLLRDEDNARYRSVMKNTLEFDPEILKRYVNFMNNPDERTAVDQFGKDDKYFGICTVMATMPGLPMFGHGQIEGFSEKYGMEYRRAYRDEQPDPHLVGRHEREIFPLLHQRHLFAGVENFLLYDFFGADGHVNEDVFAFSNRAGDARSLVVYHNKFGSARGWIRGSVAFAVRTGNGDEKRLVQRTVGEGLGLNTADHSFCIFRDHVAGLEYIRSSRDIFDNGLYLELEAYRCQVFLDFREVQDNEWRQYRQLHDFLAGTGVPSIEEALRETFLQPVHYPFRELVNAETFRRLAAARMAEAGSRPDEAILDEVEQKLLHLLGEVKRFSGNTGDEGVVAEALRQKLEVLLDLPRLADDAPVAVSPAYGEAISYLRSRLDGDQITWATLFSWLFSHALGEISGQADAAQQSRSWIDEWLLGKIIAGALRELGEDDHSASRGVALIKVLTAHREWFPEDARAADRACRVLETWLKDDEVHHFIGVNRYQGMLWFNQEAFEQLLWWMLVTAAAELGAGARRAPVGVGEADNDHVPVSAVTSGPEQQGPAANGDGQFAGEIVARYAVIRQLRQAAAESKYQVDRLRQAALGSGQGAQGAAGN